MVRSIQRMRVHIRLKKEVHEKGAHAAHHRRKPIRAYASNSASSSVPSLCTKDHVRVTCVPVYRIRSRGLQQVQWRPEVEERLSQVAKS